MKQPIYIRVESIRQEKGVSKRHIARHCGRSDAWYSDISKGKIRLTVEDLELISEALEVNPAIFFKY